MRGLAIGLLTVVACTGAASAGRAGRDRLTDLLVYFADGARRVGVIRPDGAGENYPTFGLPPQSALRMGAVAPDGRSAELLNLTDGKVWRYDFLARTVREITQTLGDVLPGGTRYLHTANAASVFSIYTTDAAGAARQDVLSTPGYAYGVSLSPDRRSVAYHITNVPGRPGYEIFVVDLPSGKARLIASDPKYIHFAPLWSPDGKWLLYQRCAHLEDPGHDRSDLCLSRADGSEHRVLTTGQSHWFAAAVGTPASHSSGSNVPAWSPDGRYIACTLLLPGSRTAWPYQANRPDTDHFNRDYHPEQAAGGTRICLIDVKSGRITPITHDEPPTWNFRLTWSPDGRRLAFMRAKVGGLPELWVMPVHGGAPRFLTGGLDGTGADHARWIRSAASSL